MRRECGDVGEMRWAGQRVVMFSGERAHEAFFRAPDELLDQAAAYPFMTPVFGRGGRLRRVARAAQAGHEEQLAARQDDARPRRAHRRRDRAHDRELGRGRGDRPARLLRRAHALHLERLPGGTGVPRRAHPGVLVALPGSRARHRRPGLREPLPADPLLPQARQGAQAAGRADPGDHRPARARGPQDPGPGLHPHHPEGRERHAALHGRPDHRDVHLDDVRGAPHHLGHLGLDAPRAAAPTRT